MAASDTTTVTLRFSHDGIGPPVYVSASWTEPPWDRLEMEHRPREKADPADHDEYDFYKDVTLPPGRYQYKFYAGNSWILDEHAETVTDDQGNQNSLLVTTSKNKVSNPEPAESSKLAPPEEDTGPVLAPNPAGEDPDEGLPEKSSSLSEKPSENDGKPSDSIKELASAQEPSLDEPSSDTPATEKTSAGGPADLSHESIDSPQKLLSALKDRIEDASATSTAHSNDDEASTHITTDPDDSIHQSPPSTRHPNFTEEIPIPFTVVEKVPDEVSPDPENRERLDEDSDKRKADAEPDQEIIAPEYQAGTTSEQTLPEPVPRIVLEQPDSRPSHGDDFCDEATPAQKLAHELRAADAKPEEVHHIDEPTVEIPHPIVESPTAVNEDSSKSIVPSAQADAGSDETKDSSDAGIPKPTDDASLPGNNSENPTTTRDLSAFAAAIGHNFDRDSPLIEHENAPLFAHETFDAGQKKKGKKALARKLQGRSSLIDQMSRENSSGDDSNVETESPVVERGRTEGLSPTRVDPYKGHEQALASSGDSLDIKRSPSLVSIPEEEETSTDPLELPHAILNASDSGTSATGPNLSAADLATKDHDIPLPDLVAPDDSASPAGSEVSAPEPHREDVVREAAVEEPTKPSEHAPVVILEPRGSLIDFEQISEPEKGPNLANTSIDKEAHSFEKEDLTPRDELAASIVLDPIEPENVPVKETLIDSQKTTSSSIAEPVALRDIALSEGLPELAVKGQSSASDDTKASPPLDSDDSKPHAAGDVLEGPDVEQNDPVEIVTPAVLPANSIEVEDHAPEVAVVQPLSGGEQSGVSKSTPHTTPDSDVHPPTDVLDESTVDQSDTSLGNQDATSKVIDVDPNEEIGVALLPDTPATVSETGDDDKSSSLAEQNVPSTTSETLLVNVLDSSVDIEGPARESAAKEGSNESDSKPPVDASTPDSVAVPAHEPALANITEQTGTDSTVDITPAESAPQHVDRSLIEHVGKQIVLTDPRPDTTTHESARSVEDDNVDLTPVTNELADSDLVGPGATPAPIELPPVSILPDSRNSGVEQPGTTKSDAQPSPLHRPVTTTDSSEPAAISEEPALRDLAKDPDQDKSVDVPSLATGDPVPTEDSPQTKEDQPGPSGTPEGTLPGTSDAPAPATTEDSKRKLLHEVAGATTLGDTVEAVRKQRELPTDSAEHTTGTKEAQVPPPPKEDAATPHDSALPSPSTPPLDPPISTLENLLPSASATTKERNPNPNFLSAFFQAVLMSWLTGLVGLFRRRKVD